MSERAGLPDPAFVALLADPRAALRRPQPSLPVPVLRAAADAFLASVEGPAVMGVEDHVAARDGGSVPLRLYRATNADGLPVILFVHGGGFVLGSLDTHDAMCRTLAVESGAAVVAVDYRLAPEARFPAALDDVRASLGWLAQESGALRLDTARCALAGDSAGGQLAVAAALCPGGPPLRHLGLLYPLLDPTRSSGSAQAFATGYMLTGSFLDWAWDEYRGDLDLRDPRLDVRGGALATLPSATILTAEFDPLRDEGEAFAATLRDNGVDVATRRYAGMIHGFAGLPQRTPAAAQALTFLAKRLRDALG